MTRGWRALAAGLALVAVGSGIGACGDDAPGEAEARETVAEFLPLYIDYDPAFCELLSSDQQALTALGAEQIGVTGESCTEVIEAGQAELGRSGEAGLLVPEELGAAAEDLDGAEVTIGDDVALVRVLTPQEDYGGQVSLVVEDGEWRVADLDLAG
jgi:hypothetical protein